MADWQEWANACFISLIFAYMLAKLVSVVVSFRDENLRIERDRDTSPSAPLVRQPSTTVLKEHNPVPAEHRNVLSNLETSKSHVVDPDERLVPNEADAGEEATVGSSEIPVSQGHSENDGREAVAGDEQNVKDNNKSESLLSDNEDWEGIEGTELDETFGKAASFVEKMALDPSVKIPSDLQLQFYGLYKQATEGPCSASQPPAYKLTARAKWHAWKKLGGISPEEGMQKYIALLSELYPDWNKATNVNCENQYIQASCCRGNNKLVEVDEEQSAGSSGKAGSMGPVFSVLAKQQESEDDGLEEIHVRAKAGDTKGVEELLEHNCPVDQKDYDGRTALHWAADQGHMAIVKLLISRGAQINAKDSEGQTALHYTITCQWEEITAFLLKNGADPSIKDNDGSTPYGHPPISPEQQYGGKDDYN